MRTSDVKLKVPDRQDRLARKAVELFVRRWRERTRVRLLAGIPSGTIPAWELSVGTLPQPCRPQSYTIATTDRTLTVRGADGHGVMYGLGHLLRTLAFAPERVAMPGIHETRAPAVYNRGIYFATHFNNYYEAAAIERVERYIEEMALWGFDAWMFWFDMNWFPHGFWRDPESRGMRMIGRLRRMSDTARACGLNVISGGIANEGFSRQPPPELRADTSARHGGFYQYSQICPSKPGGLEMILENRRQVVSLLGPVDGYVHWPYDQGGCGCARCAHAPGRWGRTFLEIGPKIAAVVREGNPEAQVWVSTWLMDAEERKRVYAQCDAGADWFQGIVSQAEHIGEHETDPRYARLAFPEISMFNCYFTSYGCNGANPAPRRMADEASRIARAGWGTQLYSEGIYTDVNAAVYAGRLWAPEREAKEIVEEYARYYLGASNVKAAAALIGGLETTWGAKALLAADPETVAGLRAKARALRTRLPRHRDARDRWRMLRDRAEMDFLMKAAGPDRELAVESRELFEGAPYLPIAELRVRARRFVAELRRRKKLVDRLMDAHWRYMAYFEMESNVLVFLPDEALGRHQWDSLIDPLAKASGARDEAGIRSGISRVFKRWFWFNGIDYRYLFQ